MDKVFAKMVELEQSSRSDLAGIQFGVDDATRTRAKNDRARTQAELYALLDTLDVDQLRAYADYRRPFLAKA